MSATLDAALLTQLKDLFDDEFDDMVRLFLADAQRTMTQLQRALEADDAAGVRRSAHALKGSARNLGALPLAARWEAMEHAMKSRAPAAELTHLFALARGAYDEVARELTEHHVSG